MNYATDRQALVKRLIDIAGGLVGCILTGIIFIFVGPAIYISSPGPIFFSQTRIGQNGKPFKMYKFRSMYMDAEARKAELMSQNKMSDGRMFKLDFDPRVIGNKIFPDGRKKTGIGEFIRKTSLDEFPQFWNVLNGSMSLVGTRPILPDELEQYELHHRARIAIKPGITGMWQVSGRSDITDFEEIVRLDAIIPISTPTPEIDWEKAAWSNEKSDIMQVLFVGSKYYPNIIGIKWFYKNVLPKLNNNIIINIVGRGTEILKKELTDCRIRIYGSVDSLAPYYMGADVIIAPLFDGGGMKTKTVEALSYGKSIVATDEGLEGFWQEMDSTIQNRFVFKTNDENEWIKKLNEMSKEKPLKYNQEVFDLFVKKFSYEATRDAMWNVL